MWFSLLLLGFFGIMVYKSYYKILILGKVIYLATQIVWISFLQWANHSLIQVDKDTIVLRYVWKNNLYKIRINTNYTKPSILTILDEKEHIVTDDVLPYLGPSLDWHGQAVEASTFGYKKLFMIDEEGEEFQV